MSCFGKATVQDTKINFNTIYDKEKHQVLTYEKLAAANVGCFLLKK